MPVTDTNKKPAGAPRPARGKRADKAMKMELTLKFDVTDTKRDLRVLGELLYGAKSAHKELNLDWSTIRERQEAA